MGDQGAFDAWHMPVILEPTLDGWMRPQGRDFVDGTVGGGGHSSRLLARMPEARVLGVDRDPEALAQAAQRLAAYGDRATLVQGSYADIAVHLATAGFPTQVDGILLDLGVSSHQLDADYRGFSFRLEGPLDMRFDPTDSSVPTAADLVNTASQQALIEIFRRWGEEPRAVVAAKAIVAQRETKLFVETKDLFACLDQVLNKPQYRRKKKRRSKPDQRGSHPVTRCFQALRIAVNQELQQLDRFLEEALSYLKPGGRLAVISFHSLEDRRIKHVFRDWAKDCVCPPDFPVCACEHRARVKLLTSKAIRASAEEVDANPRARSALLRVCEKLDVFGE